MNDHVSHSAHSLENEAAATRARLSGHLDGLADSLTPGRMLDEVLTYSKRGGSGFLRGLGGAAAANPIPTLLVTAGCALFLSGRGRMGGSRPSREPVTPRRTEYERSVEQKNAANRASVLSTMSETVGDAVQSVRTAVSASAGKITDTVSEAGSRMEESARAVGETVGDYAETTKDRLRETSEQARARATLFGRQINDRTADLFEEQPLLVAAGGLMVGAVIAALLPRTAFEDTYLGDTSDSVKEAVGAVASERYRDVKAAAGEVVSKVKDAVKDEEIVKSATEAVQSLGGKIKKVAAMGRSAVEEQGAKLAQGDG
jgi:ElaB/YqjD/DUF883 family membrane-anchored ribosome-binding protein